MGSMDVGMKATLGVALAFFLWYIVFMTGILGSFWFRVTLASMTLATYAMIADKARMTEIVGTISPTDIVHGVSSGCLLYAIFLLGFNILRPFVEGGASRVYLFRADATPFVVAFLLVITSVCEEYFWRGFTQRILSDAYNTWMGLAATTLAYALIHIPTFNVPLVAAAFLAGLFWAVLYERRRSLWLVIFSHIVWTELIFVILPLV